MDSPLLSITMSLNSFSEMEKTCFTQQKTEVVAEAERQHWFRRQPMYARRVHRRDELDNPEWLQSSAKTETKKCRAT